MSEFLKVEGQEYLVRDTSNKAIINTNSKDYHLYMARRTASLSQKEQLERQGRELDQVKSDISEIKQMLSLLINKQ